MLAVLTILFIGSALLAWAATGAAYAAMQRRNIVAAVNERSHHTTPVTLGGGWGVIAPVLLALALLVVFTPHAPTALPLAGAMLLLVAVSWVDDLGNVSALLRFGVQIVAVAIGYQALPEGQILQGLVPPWLETVLVAVGWLWFINLYNFMDGIDGIAGVETFSIGAGIVAIALLVLPLDGMTPVLAAAVCGAAVGFLKWNWHPARIFMGDVGSIPLGFLLGFLLLSVAAQGYLVAALILPLYYLVDATYTLLRRAARGQKFWQAHREHFYQIACGGPGRDHDRVVIQIGILNMGLVVCAAAALNIGPAMLAVALALVILLCVRFQQLSQRTP
ncbi:MAG: glycosyltransferase family 4 protein [Bdellovibrionales bacterium]